MSSLTLLAEKAEPLSPEEVERMYRASALDDSVSLLASLARLCVSHERLRAELAVKPPTATDSTKIIADLKDQLRAADVVREDQRKLILSLSERVEAQSQLLSRRAEKPPEPVAFPQDLREAAEGLTLVRAYLPLAYGSGQPLVRCLDFVDLLLARFPKESA